MRYAMHVASEALRFTSDSEFDFRQKAAHDPQKNAQAEGYERSSMEPLPDNTGEPEIGGESSRA